MKTFKQWDGRHIEDWGSVCSKDYKSFCRAFKNFLKRAFPNAEIIGFKANHYDTSGFLREGDHYIYLSTNMDRYRGCHDFADTSCMNGVLYRTASNDKDYRGGSNRFTSFYDLKDDVQALFDSPYTKWDVQVP